MQRNSFIDDETLAEVAGRLRFGASRLEDRIAQMAEPEPKPWSYPTHQFDSIAEPFGLRGFEFKALQEAAMRELPNNAVLQAYYRKFLMVAKLICEDAVEKVRVHERRQSEEKQLRDSSYQAKLKQYQHRRKQLTKSWTDIRETIRTRWARLGRSLAKMLEQDARLETMGQRDVEFLVALKQFKIVEMSEDRITKIDWDLYSAMPIEDIDQVIVMMNAIPGREFIKKPTVTKLADGL